MSNSHQQINYLKPSPYIGEISFYGDNKIVEEKVSPLPTPYCQIKSESVFLPHEKESKVP